MKKMKISGKELTWYIIASFFALSGIVLATLSVIGDYLAIPTSDNWIITAQTAVSDFLKIPLDWLAWGMIFLAIGLIIGVISLLYFAKKDIAEKEKAMRRAQRLGAEIVSTEE
ncbi:MAG TPA: hypothetical protein DCX17_00115 [Firmicutes bacterium]|jgi:ABC-type antimicrobial peptide transport system permease subunit|nr:hypothetical protein [Bacillota bacterium]